MKMTEYNDDRQTYYDLLRVIAMFMVIGVHAVGSIQDYCPDNSFSQLLLSLFCWLNDRGVSIFFALSGMFALGKTYPNLKKYYLNRATRLLIPLLLYSVVYIVYFVGYEEHNILAIPSQYIIRLLTSGAHNTHWFVYALLGLTFVTPFLAKMFASINDKQLAVLYIGVLSLFLLQDFFSLFDLQFCISNIVFNQIHLFYYISGYCVLRLSRNFKPSKSIYKYALILFLIIIGNIFKNILIIPCLLLSSLFLFPNTVSNAKGKIGRLFFHISNYSFSIYLIHAAVVSFLLKFYDNWGHLFVLKMILIYFVVFTISYLISLVVDNILTKRIMELCRNTITKHCID